MLAGKKSAQDFAPVDSGAVIAWKYALVLTLLGLSLYVDYATGYEVFTHFLYILPIALSVFFFGKWSGALTVLASTVGWAWADQASGHHYTNAAIFYWNALAQAVFFSLALLTALYVQRSLNLSKARIRAFSGDIPVCTQCRKICSHDGDWSNFETYILENSDANPVHKICPGCARETYAKGHVTMSA